MVGTGEERLQPVELTLRRQLLSADPPRRRRQGVRHELNGAEVATPRGLLAVDSKNGAMRLREISQMITDSPALLAREQQILASYTDSLAELIADETGAGAGDPRPAVTAAALIGVHRTLIDHVRRHLLAGDDLPGVARDIRRVAKKAFAHLEHDLGAYAPKR